MDPVHSFTYTVQSNLCTDRYPNNTSYHFRNYFPRLQNLAGYKVGLVSAYITDNYEKPDFLPVVHTKIENSNFFNEYNSDHEIVVQSTTINAVTVVLSQKKLANFIDYLNDLFENAKIPCQINAEFESGVIKSIKIIFTPASDFKLSIPSPLNTILGFSTHVFSSGEFTNDLGFNENLDSIEIQPNVNLGVVNMYKYKQETVELDPIPIDTGKPQLQELLSETVGTLYSKQHDVALRILPGTNKLSFRVAPKNKRIIFSKFLNRYLGLDDNFYFQGSGTIEVPRKILNPSEIEDFLSLPTRSSSKLFFLCNLVESQYFGGKSLPILAMVDRYTRHNIESEYVQNPILYKPVILEHVDHIEIKIQSDEGSSINHHLVPSVVTLNFELIGPT